MPHHNILLQGKLRLITPWLVWKLTEIIFTIVLIFKGTLSHHDRYSTANTILAFLIVGKYTCAFAILQLQYSIRNVINFKGCNFVNSYFLYSKTEEYLEKNINYVSVESIHFYYKIMNVKLFFNLYSNTLQ